MHRITISIDDPLAEALDEFLAATGYQSRSEGLRDLVREAMRPESETAKGHTHSVASLSYIYNHRVRSLASRLSNMQHDHHDLIISTTLVHLDHDSSLESILLKGESARVRDFANHVTSQRGVQSVVLNQVGVKPGDQHADKNAHSHSGHAHLSPTVS